MSQPYVGEIRMFAGGFAPNGWAFCDGSQMPISEYETLFQLIGTTYGGDGESTFHLPDLRGRRPLHQGQRDGRSFVLGETGGTESVTLTTNQLPAHSHPPLAGATATVSDPNGAAWARWHDVPFTTVAPDVDLNPNALAATGGGQPHENRTPFLAVHFVISLFGIFPTPT